MKFTFSKLAQGGTSALDHAEAHRRAQQFREQEIASRQQLEVKPAAWLKERIFTAAYNVTTNTPTDGSDEGVETMWGRVFAEVRSATHSGGSGSFTGKLVASQNGVRCNVRAPGTSTVLAGSVRFWLQDPQTKKWGLGGVDEPLATGENSVWTTDQFTTVGAR